MEKIDDTNGLFEKAKEKFVRTNILVLGKTGVCKSILINSIFCKDLADTGTGKPYTNNIK